MEGKGLSVHLHRECDGVCVLTQGCMVKRMGQHVMCVGGGGEGLQKSLLF